MCASASRSPIPDPVLERQRTRIKIEGDPPSPLDPMSAFRFMPSRAPIDPSAPVLFPALQEVEPGHFVAEFET